MTAARLIVADSFRVHPGGKIVGQAYHRQRFHTSVETMLGRYDTEQAAPIITSLPAFLDRAFSTIAAQAGFPRLELWEEEGALRLAFTCRELPPITDELELTSRSVDTVPGLQLTAIKGPNIDVHSALVEQHGTEVLLTRENRSILEGTRTSILWWRDDVLTAVSDRNRVASVMERVVLGVASDLGYAWQLGEITPCELTGFEVWAVNALHGIRVVTHIDGNLTREAVQERLNRFRHAVLTRA